MLERRDFGAPVLAVLRRWAADRLVAKSGLAMLPPVGSQARLGARPSGIGPQLVRFNEHNGATAGQAYAKSLECGFAGVANLEFLA